MCFWHVYGDVDGDALCENEKTKTIETFYAIFEFFPLLFALSFACYADSIVVWLKGIGRRKAQQELYSNDEFLLLAAFIVVVRHLC